MALDLLTKDNQQNEFRVNDFTKKYLLSNSPDSLSGCIFHYYSYYYFKEWKKELLWLIKDIIHSNDVVYNLFAALDSSIKSGTTCWKDSKLLNYSGDATEEEITKSAFSQLYKTEEV